MQLCNDSFKGYTKNLYIFAVLQFWLISFTSYLLPGNRTKFMTGIVVLISQFTPSQCFCYTLKCPNKGCKQHSHLSDSRAGAIQHTAFCMLRLSQIFSSYPPVIILPLQGKRIQSHRSFTTLYKPLGLRRKTWQNWHTQILFLPLLL